MVVRVQPLPRFLVLTAHERVQRAVHTQEEQCELALFRVGVQSAAMLETLHRGLTGADHRGQVAVAQPEPCGRGENRLGEYRPGFRVVGWANRGGHSPARYQALYFNCKVTADLAADLTADLTADVTADLTTR